MMNKTGSLKYYVDLQGKRAPKRTDYALSSWQTLDITE